MLMRILTDNPGRSFTKNIDPNFVKAVKELLRGCRDVSVQQILRETLDTFMTDKADNETLEPLLEMWKKEKARGTKHSKYLDNSVGMMKNLLYSQRFPLLAENTHLKQAAREQTIHGQGRSSRSSNTGNHFARQHRQPRSLPAPDELAARIEEARTTAKLLSQTVQTTPAADLPANELVKEFADRASSASHSIQGYIHTTNPAPDEDTMLTLIEVNDQLSFAMSKHQRALLQARKAGFGPAAAPQVQPQSESHSSPSALPLQRSGSGRIDDQTPSFAAPTPPEKSPRRIYVPPTHLTNGGHQAPAEQKWQRSQSPTKYPASDDMARNTNSTHGNNQSPHDNPFADEPQQSAMLSQPSYGLFSQPNQAAFLDRRDQNQNNDEDDLYGDNEKRNASNVESFQFYTDHNPPPPPPPRQTPVFRSNLSYPSKNPDSEVSENRDSVTWGQGPDRHEKPISPSRSTTASTKGR